MAAGKSEDSPTRQVWVISVVHPGAVVRGDWAAEPQQYEYLKRARALAAGTWEPPDHTTLLSKFNHNTRGAGVDPTLSDIQERFRDWRERGATLTCDIECAGPHLVCIGFCEIKTLAGCVVRFRGPAGVTLWGDELPDVVELVYELLADPKVGKWFHNGQSFDIPYLQIQGFKVEGFEGDTLLMQRYMFPETDASLQGCATFYAGMPAWKWLSSQTNKDEEGDGK